MKSNLIIAIAFFISACKPNVPILSANYMYDCSDFNFITFLSDNKKWAMTVTISGDEFVEIMDQSYYENRIVDVDLIVDEEATDKEAYVNIFGTENGYYHCGRSSSISPDVEDRSWIDYSYEMYTGIIHASVDSKMKLDIDSCGVFAIIDFHFSDFSFKNESGQDRTELLSDKILNNYNDVPIQSECD